MIQLKITIKSNGKEFQKIISFINGLKRDFAIKLLNQIKLFNKKCWNLREKKRKNKEERMKENKEKNSLKKKENKKDKMKMEMPMHLQKTIKNQESLICKHKCQLLYQSQNSKS